ncbi:MAG: hypothetical protein GX587_07380 [Bacteroidales bacterium]|nr:hypothetical protein [Bacteroidales bacterium]
MNKPTFFSVLLLLSGMLFLSSIARSQNEISFYKWTIKTAYSQIYTFNGATTSGNTIIRWQKAGQFQLNGYYHPSRFYSTGLYASYSSFPASNPPSGSNISIFTVGVNPEFFITPVIFPKLKTRFDIYAGLKLGARYVKTQEFSPSLFEPKAELCGGGGLAWYPWKRINIFCEYYYGEQANPNQKHTLSFGLGVKI